MRHSPVPIADATPMAGATSTATLLARLDGMIHEALGPTIRPGAPIAILDFPDIRNCGDSAIWLGEMAWLAKRFGAEPAYVCREHDFSKAALMDAAPEGPIFIHGGGNFGDIWPGKQDFREHVLDCFPDREIIQFPQSIHFMAQDRIARTARAIARHGRFRLFVRDRRSLDFARRHFDCEAHLCPDMAFAIGPVTARRARMPVLAMLRNDQEKADIGPWAYPDMAREDWVTENRYKVKATKLVAAIGAGLAPRAYRKFRFLDAAAHQRFRRGIRQIERGRVLVTDRLHVHICATLLGRPHAVLDNNYGKISGLMDSFYPGQNHLAERTDSLDKAVAWARARAAVMAAKGE